jgi:hypothetical protein
MLIQAQTMMYRQTSTVEKSRLMMRFSSSSSISRQHSFENYLARVFVLIFCRIAFHRCSQISATKSHDTLYKIFFLLLWKNRLLRTCRKTSSHWIWRRDNHLRRLSLNFRFERYWWSHILSNIQWKLETSFFHFFWVYLLLWKVKTLCNQTFWNEQSHFELILSAIFAWKSMMSLNSMMTTTFDSICVQRRDNILSKNLSTISHAFLCILLFRLTTHQNVQIFRFVQKYSSSINFNWFFARAFSFQVFYRWRFLDQCV